MIRAAGVDDKEHLIAISTRAKIDSLAGRPLLVDTGDRALDRMLSGYVQVITGYNERIVYRVSGEPNPL